MSSRTHVEAIFVSCDIVGHGADSDQSRQVARIESLNACIRRVCGQYFGSEVIWASGGDGGHVAFLDDSHIETAIELIGNLFQWAQAQEASVNEPWSKLRLTAHRGPVSVIEGADGRRDLAGDGINLCGSLLKFGAPETVLVTSEFRDLIERKRTSGGEVLPQITFDRERMIYLKHHRPNTVAHMSLPGAFVSSQAVSAGSDRDMLESAVSNSRFWAAIYHAKRLLQIDSTDPIATSTLPLISPSQLVISGPASGRVEAHPLFSQMNRQSMQDLVQNAHLVERDDGETICLQGDAGDAMFIVLRGQIGVVQSAPHAAPQVQPRPLFDLSFGEGRIVGELALALSRRRTTTLQAIGQTAFLSINYSTLQSLLAAKPRNARLERAFNEFLLDRSLSFICGNCSYLSQDATSPLAGIDQPWERLTEGSQQLTLDWREADSFLTSRDRFKDSGLYILAGGRLTEASQIDAVRKILDAQNLPIAFINLPNAIVSHYHNFQIDPESGSSLVKIIHISDRALTSFGPAAYGKLLDAIKLQLSKQFVFDVFISYASQDEHIATVWRDTMQRSGLRVYMSRPEGLRRFKNEIELALAESLVMIPFVSDRATAPDGEVGWVQREIGYRRTLFDEAHCNILPIELTRGMAQSLADGFSAIAVTGTGQDSIGEAIEAVQAVRSGKKAPPFAVHHEEKARL